MVWGGTASVLTQGAANLVANKAALAAGLQSSVGNGGSITAALAANTPGANGQNGYVCIQFMQ